MSDRDLLVIALEAAIPLHAAELEGLPESTRLRIARHAGEVLACHGDVLMFRRKDTTEVFNAVARGLAAAQTLGHDVDWVLRRIQEVDTIKTPS